MQPAAEAVAEVAVAAYPLGGGPPAQAVRFATLPIDIRTAVLPVDT